ncbi:dual specificity protein phosphatase family protein [Pararhizobium sp. PWRC1-1]|uniref:dual specificity protein phosphatase family protein n=1 Tax=Pararhizobium sp. PWRC1-1 TaxID=2804566 RepID=UPI003CF9407D
MIIRVLKCSALVAFAGVLAFGAYFLAIQATGNFYAVVPGELYRSNQPTSAQVADYTKRYGIKTIVNLRGSSEDAAWYKDEVATAASLSVNHIDFRMSARQQLTLEETQKLVTLLRDAPKPILIHCKSGADRTGLASAIYLHQIANASEDTAEGQLSVRFGHLGIPYLSSTYAMDENWENLEKTFGQQG